LAQAILAPNTHKEGGSHLGMVKEEGPSTSGKPFESCAAELVDESLHPLAQLEALEEKVKDLEALNDLDAVIECKIKALALHRLLVYLHDFPIHPLIRAEIALAEAYVAGGFFKQAQEHTRVLFLKKTLWQYRF